MIASDGDFDGAFDEVLAFDFREIQIVCSVSGENEILPHGQQFALLSEEFKGLAQVGHPVNLNPVDHRGLARIEPWNDHRFLALPARFHRDRQRSLDRTNFSVERELTCHQAPPQPRELGPLGDRDHAYRDRKIEARPFLPQVGRREIDGRARPGPAKAAVGDCCRHPILALPHGGVGQADEHNHGVARARIDFYLHLNRLDSLDCRRKDAREHAGMLPSSRPVCPIRVSRDFPNPPRNVMLPDTLSLPALPNESNHHKRNQSDLTIQRMEPFISRRARVHAPHATVAPSQSSPEPVALNRPLAFAMASASAVFLAFLSVLGQLATRELSVVQRYSFGSSHPVWSSLRCCAARHGKHWRE